MAHEPQSRTWKPRHLGRSGWESLQNPWVLGIVRLKPRTVPKRNSVWVRSCNQAMRRQSGRQDPRRASCTVDFGDAMECAWLTTWSCQGCCSGDGRYGLVQVPAILESISGPARKCSTITVELRPFDFYFEQCFTKLSIPTLNKHYSQESLKLQSSCLSILISWNYRLMLFKVYFFFHENPWGGKIWGSRVEEK